MKTFKEKNIKNYLKILAFILVFVLLLEGLSVTLFSKRAAVSYANKLADAYSFTEEPKDSIQIAGIGNSDLYSGFVPATMWENFGYTSTLISSPRQTPLQSYEMMTELLKNQCPDLIIIEVDMLYPSVPDKRSKIKSEQSLDSFFEFFDSNNFEDIIAGHFTIFTFHDKWKKVTDKKHKVFKKSNSHGYRYSKLVRKFKVKNYMSESSDSEKISKINTDYLDKMISLCKSKNIDVLLLELPSVNSWNFERHNAVKQLADDYNINFVDLNMCLDDMNLDVSTDFRDLGNHLNYNGANKATKYLGSYIKNNYIIDDKRGDAAYNYWNESCEAFKKELI
ncbi:MAG: hypothetical protein ACLUFN_06835 [Eubacterium sp.]